MKNNKSKILLNVGFYNQKKKKHYSNEDKTKHFPNYKSWKYSSLADSEDNKC